jgi:SAM-dependent methyltransferase
LSVVSSTYATKRGAHWGVLYSAVALTTMATLVLELSLTRIFSVVFYYHFAFLAISIALFGLGAGGVLSYYIAGEGKDLYRRLGLISAANALAVVVSLASILSMAGSSGFWHFAAIYFVSSIPFVLSGITVSLAISATISRVDRVYFFDLLGAAGGCLLLIPFLNILGGPGTVIASAVLFAAASAVWYGMAGSSSGRAAGVALALALVLLVIFNKGSQIIDIHTAKGREIGNEEFVKWNTFSRIAVTTNPDGGKLIAIDADATTGLSQFDLDNLSADDRKALESDGPAFAYHMRPGAKSLILGPGGGWDVARALASGSKDVTGVEINPIIANTIMRERYKGENKGIYLRPEVRLFVEDGRSYVRRSDEKYQVIQATLVDTWASTAAGAFALSENNIYTVEAFEDYLRHLTPDGILVWTRWGFEPPRESLRLLSLARVALEKLGEKESWRHAVVVREKSNLIRGWGATDTVVISRKPLSDADIQRARETAAKGGFEEVYFPDTKQPGAFTGLLTAADPESFYRAYPYNVRPVHDDKPFFFYTVQTGDVWTFVRDWTRLSADYKINMAVPTLFSLVGVSLLAVAVTLLLPPVLLRTRLPKEPGVPVFLAYFVCLGIGYILVQVGLIQKLVLFLGHPAYALTVVIFSMLVSSGTGSFFSRKIVRGRDSRLMAVLAAAAAVVALSALIATPLTTKAVGLALPLKVVTTILLIAPAGFLMGIPFPSGLSRLEKWHSPSVRWAWSLNAASSVLGSAAAILLALYLGLSNTLLIGAGLYVVALLVVRLTPRGSAAA